MQKGVIICFIFIIFVLSLCTASAGIGDMLIEGLDKLGAMPKESISGTELIERTIENSCRIKTIIADAKADFEMTDSSGTQKWSVSYPNAAIELDNLKDTRVAFEASSGIFKVKDVIIGNKIYSDVKGISKLYSFMGKSIDESKIPGFYIDSPCNYFSPMPWLALVSNPQIIGEEYVDGKDCAIISGGLPQGTAKIWVWKKEAIPIKVDMTYSYASGVSGKVTMHHKMTFNNIKIDEPIDSSRFDIGTRQYLSMGEWVKFTTAEVLRQITGEKDASGGIIDVVGEMIGQMLDTFGSADMASACNAIGLNNPITVCSGEEECEIGPDIECCEDGTCDKGKCCKDNKCSTIQEACGVIPVGEPYDTICKGAKGVEICINNKIDSCASFDNYAQLTKYEVEARACCGECKAGCNKFCENSRTESGVDKEPCSKTKSCRITNQKMKKCIALYSINALGPAAEWMKGYNRAELKEGMVDDAGYISLEQKTTGTCVDYSIALTSLLRTAGYSADDVYTVGAPGHSYNLVRFPGESKFRIVDTTGNNANPSKNWQWGMRVIEQTEYGPRPKMKYFNHCDFDICVNDVVGGGATGRKECKGITSRGKCPDKSMVIGC